MQIKNKINKAARKAKITRYRTYKKWGFVGHRRQIDRWAKGVFAVLLILISASFFFWRPNTDPNMVSEVLTAEEKNTSLEQVHEDLGNAPVEPEATASLSALEEGALAGRLKMDRYILKKNEALLTLLGRAAIAVSERGDIIEALSLLIDLKSLQPGMGVLVFKDQKGQFLGLSIPLSDGEVVAVLKEASGVYTPFSHEGRIETKNVRVTGSVERTFSGSAKKAGVPAGLVSQIINVLDGEVDFSTFRKDDQFDIIYEKKETSSGLELGDKQLLYIGLKIGKKEIHRYAWTDKSGLTTFYNAKGESSAKTLLKRPAKARTRLSSPYGWRRHPILMANIFHSGVDLACPMNTPVMAAGDGVITQLGRKGAYGKYIRIRHSNGYQTAYGHMNGYKAGLKPGSKVKRGDVIGYVGQTGRATGPHVHFEVWKNGKTVNPFGNYILIAKQLKGFELDQFQSQAESIHLDFKKHLVGTLAPVPPRKPAFDKSALLRTVPAFMTKPIWA